MRSRGEEIAYREGEIAGLRAAASVARIPVSKAGSVARPKVRSLRDVWNARAVAQKVSRRAVVKAEVPVRPRARTLAEVWAERGTVAKARAVQRKVPRPVPSKQVASSTPVGRAVRSGVIRDQAEARIAAEAISSARAARVRAGSDPGRRAIADAELRVAASVAAERIAEHRRRGG